RRSRGDRRRRRASARGVAAATSRGPAADGSIVLDRHGCDGDGLDRTVTSARSAGRDGVDDVEAAGDLAEEGVVLGQLPAQVLVADEELAAVGVRAAVGHRDGAAGVLALDRFVGKLVAGTAGSHPVRVELRLLAVLAVAALDDEARNDAVEYDLVVEPLLREVDEVAGGVVGAIGEQLDLDVALVGGEGRARHALSLQGWRTACWGAPTASRPGGSWLFWR